jgi:SHS2 domain-containing protein
MKGYEIFYTTADVGIKIRGKTYGIQTLSDHASSDYPFDFKGDSCENVLVNLLSEIIFLLYSRDCITTGIAIKIADETALQADLIIQPMQNPPEVEVKSVTYHNLKVKECRGVKSAAIIFDI